MYHDHTGVNDIKALEAMQKSDILDLFDQYMKQGAPHRAKLVVRMQSQRMSTESLLAIQAAAKENSVESSPELDAAFATHPTFDAAKKALQDHFTAASVDEKAADAILARLAELQSPALRTGEMAVDKAWRKTLQLGPAAEPVQAYFDSLSKL